MSLLDESWAFETAIQDRCSTRIEPFRFGTAIFRDDMPRVHDQNMLRVERGFGDIRARELASEADRLQRPAGLSHRKVVVPDDAAGQRLEPQFRELGWRRARHVVMAFGGAPPAAPSLPVAVVGQGALRASRIVAMVQDLGSGAAEQVAASLELIAGVVARSRAFAVEADGRPVSWCTLYEEDGIGQIDDVVTQSPHRRRGYARAVVEAATRASLESGNRLTFLVADDDDWPKEMYSRIGYERIGRRFEFTRL